MSENYRKPIGSLNKLPQFTTMNVIDGQAGLIIYTSLIFYSLTIDNILNIIVLLILAGISIATLTGDNGVLKSTLSAKEKAEISNEKEILEVATVQAMGRDRAGIVTKIRLQTALDENTSEGITNVEEDEEILLTTFVQSGRIYEVDKDGNIKYLGKEEELLSQVTIEASPQSNTTPELVQNIKLTVKSIVSIPDENVTLKCKDVKDNYKVVQNVLYIKSLNL